MRNTLVSFGMDLGIAFQIQDDILNLVGEVDKYGKEIGGDLWEGKRTLVMIDLLRKCSEKEKAFVTEVLNTSRTQKSQADINEILAIIERYKCIHYAGRVSRDLAAKARRTFMESFDGTVVQDYRQVIVDLVDFVVNREF